MAGLTVLANVRANSPGESKTNVLAKDRANSPGVRQAITIIATVTLTFGQFLYFSVKL